MKRYAEIFMSVCFLSFLAVGLAATLTRAPETTSYWENRALARLPDFTAQGVGDGSYMLSLEEYFSDHAMLRTTMLMTKTRLDLALRRPVVNDVVVTEDYLLPYLTPNMASQAYINAAAESMSETLQHINDTVTGYGGYFCYVAVPCQAVSLSREYPWYLEDQEEFNSRKIAALTQAAARSGVPVLDVQAAMAAADGYVQYASRVDNHYSMLGAYETYRLIMEKTAADTGLEFPILSMDELTLVTLPNEFLGSRERKLFNLAPREEQLSVLLPRQEVPYTRSDNGDPAPAYVYALPDSDEIPVTYNLYMGGDIARTVIDTGRDELPSILIYGDSFTNPVECLAYLSFDEMYSLDLRHYKDMDLEEYIRQIQPEVVVCIRDYDFLLDPRGNGGSPA